LALATVKPTRGDDGKFTQIVDQFSGKYDSR
jgi:hypothetical protein